MTQPTEADQSLTICESQPPAEVRWPKRRLSTLGTFSRGHGIHKVDLIADGIPAVRYGEIYTHHSDVIDRFFSFVSLESAKKSVRLRKGDVLFVRPGETAEEIGKCTAFVSDAEVYAGDDVLIFSPRGVDSRYLSYTMNHHHEVMRERQRLAQGEMIVHTSPASLGQIEIPLPSVDEQKAIVTPLTDSDALIAGLDTLIAKKAAMKQGAVQQLLTGKIRLAGFNDPWMDSTLGSIAKISKGIQRNRETLVEAGYPVWNGGVTPSGFTDEWNTPENTITISEGGNSCGFVGFISERFWCGGHCYALKELSTSFDLRFTYQNLKYHQMELMSLRVGSGLPNVQKKRLLAYSIKHPGINEQRAIGTVLSDMDLELKVLERRRDKIQAIKQGMIQSLLSGRVRLVRRGNDVSASVEKVGS